MAVCATFAALIVVPMSFGGLVGMALRQVYGRHPGGIVAAAAFLILPLGVVTLFVLRSPFIGVWDALLEGLLVSAGVEWTAHRAFADRENVVLMAGSLIVGLIVVEIIYRLFLPPPPAFPTERGPHFLLADAMRAGAESHSWDLRSKELVCSIIYGEQYQGILDVSGERDVIVPRRFAPLAGATRRVLHIGDSMAFGFGVSRNETFTAGLEHLEPGSQHINGGIPGTAPDAYLLVLQQWIARQRVDLAVMYVFEANDVVGLDDRYPCCQWGSLLTYAARGPALHCPTAAPIDFAKAGATWLVYNSPPPYLVRALVGYSAAAAYLGAAIVSRGPLMPLAAPPSVETGLRHLEAILGAARDELRTRHIGFVVVVLPSRSWVENSINAEHLAPKIMELAGRLGIPALDASETLHDAVRSGAHVYFDNPGDPHFSRAGHEIIASWLHERLATAAALPATP